jgi:tartrate dehydratase alpha subunit/fumarate hydratase class I-like protein
MLEAREPIPKSTLLDKVIKSCGAKGCVPLMVGIVAPSGKAQRINIILNSELLGAIDLVAANQHKTRLALLAEAAQRLLGTL